MRRALRNAGIASVLVYGPMVMLHGACVTGFGPWAIPGSELFIFAPLAALAGALLASPFILFRRSRQHGLHVLLVSLALVLLFIPAMGASLHLRRLGFQLAAKRAEPLVGGIERFVRDQGRPPNTLADLVPQYLPSLPTRIPELELVLGEKARANYGGNDWALLAVVSTGFLNWDQFIYYPNQLYPEHGHGGGIERIGRWAYVHE